MTSKYQKRDRGLKKLPEGKVSPHDSKQQIRVECPTCKAGKRRRVEDCKLCKGTGEVDAIA